MVGVGLRKDRKIRVRIKDEGKDGIRIKEGCGRIGLGMRNNGRMGLGLRKDGVEIEKGWGRD